MYIKQITCLLLLVAISCKSNDKKKQDSTKKTMETTQDLSKYSKAYFASGCFWCVEAVFESVDGVVEVISGYSGGKETNPSYKEVSKGHTGHAESVEVFYDPKVVSYTTLVLAFFDSHDPTELNGQGPDKGRHYRSIAFYQTEEEKQIIEQQIKKKENDNVYTKPIVTQVVKFQKFWEAEEYHQNFEKRNPDQPYIQAISVPRLERFKKKHPELLNKKKH